MCIKHDKTVSVISNEMIYILRIQDADMFGAPNSIPKSMSRCIFFRTFDMMVVFGTDKFWNVKNDST